MALYANGFLFSFENRMARITLVDKNIHNGEEVKVGEIVTTDDSMIQFAHGILKAHEEHKAKLMAVANGELVQVDSMQGEAVN